MISNSTKSKQINLPKINEVIYSFRVINIDEINIINSKTIIFEHEKSGAKLLYIKNDDKNRTFNIAFKTPTNDNTGVNHVLEHIVVSGSKKYPFKNILFTILNQTYSTFINAFTSYNFTAYPVASMSEEQLLKLTDIYMDCTFNPYIYEDNKIFKREAFRYEKTDKNSPLNINGTVYTEMRGTTSDIQTASYYNTLNALFPNSIIPNISGGEPKCIPNLTYEYVLETHSKYYHPSNSLIILYGDLDYKKFLELINNYLLKYDRKEIKIETGAITPITKLVNKTYDFPVSATTNTKNTSQIDYSYAFTNLSEEDIIGFTLLANILNSDSSPIKQAFRKVDIGGNIYISFNYTYAQPVMTFSVQSTEENQKETIKKLIDEIILDISKNGFDNELVDAIISNTIISNSMITEVQNLGRDIASSLSSWWATYNNTKYFNIYTENIYNISNKSSSYFKDIIKKYILNNKHSAIIATVPKAGLLEQKEEEFKQALINKENSMTEEEIEQLINDTLEFNKWNCIEVEQDVNALQVITIAELPEEMKEYIVEDKVIDNIRYVTAEANINKISKIEFSFDTSNIPAEKLHYLNLFANLLGKISTKQHELSNLNILATRYLNDLIFNINTYVRKDEKEYNPYLQISWLTLDIECNIGMELVKEILFDTKFENTDELLNMVKYLKSIYRGNFTQNPLSIIISRNVSSYNNEFNYLEYVKNIPYYKFLDEVEELLKNSKEVVVSELNFIRDTILNKNNLIIKFAGNKNNINSFYNEVKTITDILPNNKIIKQDYSNLPRPSKQEGIVLDLEVQHNIISINYEDIGKKFNAKYIPLILATSENYLVPKLRYQNGVYSNIEEVTEDFILMATYSDPSIKETFDIYEKLSEFLDSFNITQQELDRYILKAFGNFTIPSGELKGAVKAIGEKIENVTSEDKLKFLKEIKSAIIDDFKELSEIFSKLPSNGSYATIGSLNKLNDFYTDIVIIETQSLQDETKLITKKELISLILGNTENAWEVAIAQGIIVSDNNNYGEDELTTKQYLVTILSRILKLQGIYQHIPTQIVDISDVNLISDDALEYVNIFIGLEIIHLDESGNFNPNEELTISNIYNIINKLNEFIIKNFE